MFIVCPLDEKRKVTRPAVPRNRIKTVREAREKKIADFVLACGDPQFQSVTQVRVDDDELGAQSPYSVTFTLRRSDNNSTVTATFLGVEDLKLAFGFGGMTLTPLVVEVGEWDRLNVRDGENGDSLTFKCEDFVFEQSD